MGVAFHDSLALPEKGGRWLADPLIFIENFLYIGELALFAMYVCTRFVHWLRQISSRHIALWGQSRCVQIVHTYKSDSLRSESTSWIGCSHFGSSQNPVALCYVRVHTYITKSPKRTIYATLYDTKVVPANLTSTTQVRPSCHGNSSISVALDILSSATEKLQKL